jgi:hypothetical protein
MCAKHDKVKKTSSGYGGRNFTEAKQTTLFLNESQLSVSESKILVVCYAG